MNTQIQIDADLPELAEGITRDIGELAMRIVLAIESQIKRLIQQSTPTGRTYRRGAITKPASQRLLALGLQASRLRPGKVVAGYRFHRASAPGEPPANDTSNLVNSMKARRTGEASAELDINAAYAGILEDDLNRPFVMPAIDFVIENVLPTL